MNFSRRFRWVVGIALVTVTGGIFIVQTDAQTKRKKTTKKTVAAKPTPKPLATPPTIGGAEIISRASDYQQTQPLVFEQEKPTAADPVPVDNTASKIKDLSSRVKKLETPKDDTEDKQKRLLLNLDILTRAEQRADSLRKTMFEMAEKENTVRNRLDQIENEIRPEMIERQLQVTGSMRPEEFRETRRKQLAAERTNLQSLLTDIQSTRSSLTTSVQKADEMVEKLRTKMEKDIDENLKEDVKKP